MQVLIDLELYIYILLGFGVSLSINVVALLIYVGKKYPHFLYK